MPEERYALVLKEGEVAVVEDVAEVLPIRLVLGHTELTISWMVLRWMCRYPSSSQM